MSVKNSPQVAITDTVHAQHTDTRHSDIRRANSQLWYPTRSGWTQVLVPLAAPHPSCECSKNPLMTSHRWSPSLQLQRPLLRSQLKKEHEGRASGCSVSSEPAQGTAGRCAQGNTGVGGRTLKTLRSHSPLLSASQPATHTPTPTAVALHPSSFSPAQLPLAHPTPVRSNQPLRGSLLPNELHVFTPRYPRIRRKT